MVKSWLELQRNSRKEHINARYCLVWTHVSVSSTRCRRVRAECDSRPPSRPLITLSHCPIVYQFCHSGLRPPLPIALSTISLKNSRTSVMPRYILRADANSVGSCVLKDAYPWDILFHNFLPSPTPEPMTSPVFM